jgi:hypothetical protein
MRKKGIKSHLKMEGPMPRKEYVVKLTDEERAALIASMNLSPEGDNLFPPLLDQPRPHRGHKLTQGTISLHLFHPGERKAPRTLSFLIFESKLPEESCEYQ